jgi:hypothetical protein
MIIGATNHFATCGCIARVSAELEPDFAVLGSVTNERYEIIHHLDGVRVALVE